MLLGVAKIEVSRFEPSPVKWFRYSMLLIPVCGNGEIVQPAAEEVIPVDVHVPLFGPMSTVPPVVSGVPAWNVNWHR
jgi:hypothetical protein